MDELAGELISALLKARSFEEAAALALEPMLGFTQDAIDDSRYAGRATVLRGMVHLRAGGGYRGLAVLEPGASRTTTASDGEGLTPSLTVWRWVSAHGAAAEVDVMLGRTRLVGAAAPIEGAALTFDSDASVQRLLGRDATHLYAVPLRGAGGVVAGMISVEVSCQRAMGRPFVWADAAEALQLVADLAAPYLSTLPSRSPAAPARAGDALLPVVGQSMSGLIALLRVFALQDETVLISGPTGAGKSRLAKWIHARSTRSGSPFQVVDLLTVPEEMQMGELFGWKKGAFTGAVNAHPGCVARAEGGTLFIDEIDKLSLKAQAGLLQLLESRQYRVLGDPGGARQANVRFVIGTNADLQAAVADGRFREDLYYRINVLPVWLPSLDERADEIPEWAAFMVKRRHAEASGQGAASLADDAAAALARRSWPGNLRQLDNVVRRAYAVALVDPAPPGGGLEIKLRHVERALGFELGRPERPTTPASALQQAARGFVTRARARAAAGEPALDLALAEGLRGLILAEAVSALDGDVKAAYLLFGKRRLVESRNHGKNLRKELARVRDLYAALNEEMGPELAGLMD